MLWSAIFNLYRAVVKASFITRSSAKIAPLTLLGKSFMMSLMNIRKRVGLSTPLLGEPSFSRCTFIWLNVPFTWTLDFLLCRNFEIHLYMGPCTPNLLSFRWRISYHTLSTAYSTSSQTARVWFLSWNPCSIILPTCVIWSSVEWRCVIPAWGVIIWLLSVSHTKKGIKLNPQKTAAKLVWQYKLQRQSSWEYDKKKTSREQ